MSYVSPRRAMGDDTDICAERQAAFIPPIGSASYTSMRIRNKAKLKHIWLERTPNGWELVMKTSLSINRSFLGGGKQETGRNKIQKDPKRQTLGKTQKDKHGKFSIDSRC